MSLVQVARAILENPEDKTKIHLIYANVTYDDILLKVLIDTFAFSFVLINCAVRFHISGRGPLSLSLSNSNMRCI
jgi:NAD(P)H-flavin reductase